LWGSLLLFPRRKRCRPQQRVVSLKGTRLLRERVVPGQLLEGARLLRYSSQFKNNYLAEM